MSASTTLPPPPATSPTSADWRLQIPERRRRHLRIWLWSGAALTLVILIIGGITRLTQSGLSMVDWRPIMGVLPPLNEGEWLAKFDEYRQFPEYQQLRAGMTLDEFKFIFFWEYIHRMAARLIGLVFLVPFLFFLVKGYFNRPLLLRTVGLFGLGALQAVMGWYMVMSGLVDVPHVSHYRLAAHLLIAFGIFGACLWLAADLGMKPTRRPPSRDRLVKTGIWVMGGLLVVQVLWGAFVAGLKAGLLYNTFPLMGGALVPAGMLAWDPPLMAFFQSPAAVQWMHRLLGTIFAVAAIGLVWAMARRGVDRQTVRWGWAFVGLVLVQYLLGVLTLLFYVPVSLGVIHQAFAMVLFGVWVLWLHRETRSPRLAPAAVPR